MSVLADNEIYTVLVHITGYKEDRQLSVNIIFIIETVWSLVLEKNMISNNNDCFVDL